MNISEVIMLSGIGIMILAGLAVIRITEITTKTLKKDMTILQYFILGIILLVMVIILTSLSLPCLTGKN